MRNDARPVGEHSPSSPVGGHETPPGTGRLEHVERDPTPTTVNQDDPSAPALDHESPRPAPGTYHPE